MLHLALGWALATAPLADPASDLSRFVYPLAPSRKCPPVEVDASDYPAGQAWGAAAQSLVRAWYPRICELLATDGRDPWTNAKKGSAYRAPKVIRLVIKRDLNVPAYASDGTITINGKWITAHPDDLGMMVHELTHVVQSYPDTDAGWLVEGIADYIRWWRYEPELHATQGRTKIDPEKSKYTDAYRITAVWLAWCTQKYDRRLVPALDSALRNHEDPMPVFQKVTGKDADALWREFVLGWK